MSERIWLKNAINFQHCFILKLVKYVATHMAKNAINFQHCFILKLVKYGRNAYGEKMQ